MILAKADQKIVQIYSDALLEKKYHNQTQLFLLEFHKLKTAIKKITGHTKILESQPVLKRSITIRNSYVDILNILQVELLKEYRETKNQKLEKAIALSISGVSAGMRNTG
jgi:phosphoenolpyruvate carboxylase